MSLTVNAEATTAPFVVAFADGDMSMSELLGGKGANLAEMTRLGLPVPHGFTITTAACRHYLTLGHEPADLDHQVGIHLHELEKMTGREFGDPRRSPSGVGAFGRQTLHAGDDGDRPERRHHG